MAYPFASYGSFVFSNDEVAIRFTDSYWNQAPTFARSRPLGALSDNLVLLAGGSSERTFELLLAPDRFNTLSLLVGFPSTFCDWDRPTPDSRNAMLMQIEQRERVRVTCSDGVTRWRIRTGVSLVSL